MNNIFITLKKELRSIFRDKKTLMAMLVFPIIIPIFIVIYGYMYDNIENTEEGYRFAVNYEFDDNALNIAKGMNLELVYMLDENDIKKMYEDKECDGYVIYNKDSNTFVIYTNNSNTSGMTAYALITSYFDAYQELLTNNYLINQGINLEEAYNHFKIDSVELSESNYIIQMILTISFTYVVMAICMASSNVSTFATAQEKENGTLETILTFPVKKSELLIGKYLSCVTLSVISSLISLILMIIGLSVGKANFEVYKTYEFIFNFKTIFSAIIVIISASLFISGIAFLLTSKSKSFKEAQSKVSFLNMVCLIPMFVTLLEISISLTYYLIPICNYQQILSDLFTNNVSLVNLLVTLISSIVYTFIVIVFISKTYNQEDVLFN